VPRHVSGMATAWPPSLPRTTCCTTFMPRTMPRQFKVPSSSRYARSSGQCPRWGSNPHWADFKDAALWLLWPLPATVSSPPSPLAPPADHG
jgi:hypothetical protein